MADRKEASKRQRRRSMISESVVSAVVGILALAASLLQLFSVEHWFDSTIGKIVIGALSGLAGVLTGYFLAGRRQGKGDE